MEAVARKKAFITNLIIFFGTVLLTAGVCFLKGKSNGEMIQILVTTAFFAFFMTFVYGYEFNSDGLDYDNRERPYRFLLAYCCSLILSLLFPFIDRGGWLFVSLGIALALFSNSVVGICMVSELITVSTLLSQSPGLYTFLVYFMAAVISIVVFKNIDENFNVGGSIFISMTSLFVLEVAGFIFLENKEFSAEQFIYPIVNIVINSIIMFVVLKYFNEYVVNRFRNRYLELNDQENATLISLREKSEEEYWRSIHTAYLTERIANACGLNVDVAKNLAYYHRIKPAFSYSEEEMVDFVMKNHFPPEAAKTLLDFSDKSKPIIIKEAAVVYLSDKLMSTLMMIFKKNKKQVVDYKELIEALLMKQQIQDALEDSQLSRSDFNNVREIMLREVLYYDFLR